MKQAKTIDALRYTLKTWRMVGQRIAFVPTMGNLHEGHLKLVEEAKNHADRVVVSIFVNPSQFGPQEDFANYPRTENEDLKKLRQANVDLVFLPTVAEIYPQAMHTKITVADISERHCGAFRPGHFDGVATVVCKLFNMVQPDVAIFGLKDFQQLAVIRAMVNELNIPVTLIPVETVRETGGLAMSSRNGYLTIEQKRIAEFLYQSLCMARAAVQISEQTYSRIEQDAMLYLQENGLQPEYFAICRSTDLMPAQPGDTDLVILAAAKIGKTRLIDNIAFTLPVAIQAIDIDA